MRERGRVVWLQKEKMGERERGQSMMDVWECETPKAGQGGGPINKKHYIGWLRRSERSKGLEICYFPYFQACEVVCSRSLDRAQRVKILRGCVV